MLITIIWLLALAVAILYVLGAVLARSISRYSVLAGSNSMAAYEKYKVRAMIWWPRMATVHLIAWIKESRQ